MYIYIYTYIYIYIRVGDDPYSGRREERPVSRPGCLRTSWPRLKRINHK